MARREIGWGGLDWIDLVQDKKQLWVPVNTVMNIWVPYCYEILDYLLNWQLLMGLSPWR